MLRCIFFKVKLVIPGLSESDPTRPRKPSWELWFHVASSHAVLRDVLPERGALLALLEVQLVNEVHGAGHAASGQGRQG